MMKYLLSNPKAALMFVVATMFSVAMLVGSEDNEGLLAQAVDDVEVQRAGFANEIGELDRARLPGGSGRRVMVDDSEAARGRQPGWNQFDTDPESASAPMTDDGLIDAAQGYDPSPMNPNPGGDDDLGSNSGFEDMGEIIEIRPPSRASSRQPGVGPAAEPQGRLGEGVVRPGPGAIVDN